MYSDTSSDRKLDFQRRRRGNIEPVWPDLAEIRHFGKYLKYLVIYWGTVSIWQFFMPLGKFSLLKMAKNWTNSLVIWSHCFEQNRKLDLRESKTKTDYQENPSNKQYGNFNLARKAVHSQCEQIGRFLKARGYKFSNKSGPSIWQFSRLQLKAFGHCLVNLGYFLFQHLVTPAIVQIPKAVFTQAVSAGVFA